MNHRTTTTLLVVIAAATLLAAGIVVAIVGSNHSAFAHKNYDKFNKEDKSGRDGDQYLKCIVVENGGISDNSCNNHDGATRTPTPTPTPTPTCNPSTVGGQTATLTDDTCTATLPGDATAEQRDVFDRACFSIPSIVIVNIHTGVRTCTFPSTPPA
jgi:hypothetical protein